MAKEFDYQAFVSGLPIQEGDTLDVASDLISILGYCKRERLSFSADGLLDTLQDMVGPDGTVMIRAFSWAFCKGIPFDLLHTPSQVGSLGTLVQKSSGFSRTRHALYSWWVRGKRREEFINCDFWSSFGSNSMFQKLYDCNAKQLSLGNISHPAMTHLHHAEVLSGVPYRWEKTFSGMYIDEAGECMEKSFGMHVRPLNIEVTTDNMKSESTQRLLMEKGLRIDGSPYPELQCRLYPVHEIVNFFKEELTERFGCALITVNGKDGYDRPEIDWGLARYI